MSRGQRPGYKCGYPVKVCDNCDHAVAPSLIQKGRSCPKCPDGTGVHDGGCQRSVKGPGLACHIPGHDGAPVLPRQAKAKESQAMKALERAKGALASLGGDTIFGEMDGGTAAVSDPIENLESLGAITMNLVNSMKGVVADLNQIRYSSPVIGTEQIRGELTYFLQAIRQAVDVQSSIFKLNLDERRVQIDEARAIAFANCVQVALAKADAPEGIRGRVVEALAAELKALEPGHPLRPKDRHAE